VRGRDRGERWQPSTVRLPGAKASKFLSPSGAGNRASGGREGRGRGEGGGGVSRTPPSGTGGGEGAEGGCHP